MQVSELIQRDKGRLKTNVQTAFAVVQLLPGLGQRFGKMKAEFCFNI